jgi:hypothetical protein
MTKKGTEHLKETKQEWKAAKPGHLPRLTFWPITLAAGLVFFFWGFITSVIISIAGLTAIAAALYGWIGEFNDE